MLAAGTLADRVAIVTGGSSGIGKEISAELLRLGATVAIFARNEERMRVASAELGRIGTVITHQLDVRNFEQVSKGVERVVDELGKVDMLVNNAAGNFVSPAEKLTENGWRAVIDIVLNGTFFCSQAVAKHLVKRRSGGAILNLLTTYAWTGGPGTVHSASAKAGVLAMTRTLAVEWARYGIRVNAIAPGPIENTGAAQALWSTPKKREQMIGQVPLGRAGRSEEIAWAASYLLSPFSDYVTGEVLTVDGGRWLGKPVFESSPTRDAIHPLRCQR